MLVAHYIGKKRLFNKLVQWWDLGPISHTEAILAVNADGSCLCASSSFLDGGVRQKMIRLDPAHWILTDTPIWNANRAAHWFAPRYGCRYDVRGIIGHVLPVGQSKTKWYCNEAIGAAVGVLEPWRYRPNGFLGVALAAGGKIVPIDKWIDYGITA